MFAEVFLFTVLIVHVKGLSENFQYKLYNNPEFVCFFIEKKIMIFEVKFKNVIYLIYLPAACEPPINAKIKNASTTLSFKRAIFSSTLKNKNNGQR